MCGTIARAVLEPSSVAYRCNSIWAAAALSGPCRRPGPCPIRSRSNGWLIGERRGEPCSSSCAEPNRRILSLAAERLRLDRRAARAGSEPTDIPASPGQLEEEEEGLCRPALLVSDANGFAPSASSLQAGRCGRSRRPGNHQGLHGAWNEATAAAVVGMGLRHSKCYGDVG